MNFATFLYYLQNVILFYQIIILPFLIILDKIYKYIKYYLHEILTTFQERNYMTNKQTLSDQIYDMLRKDIISQKINCGQKLTLQTLKSQFNVSHTPIRQALTRLSEDGLVTYFSNCGVSVVTFTREDIKQLYQFIGELDVLAIQFCKLSYAQEPLLFELEEIINKCISLLKDNNITEWKAYSDNFHYIFYKYAENHYLNESAQKLRAKIELISNLYYSEENVEKIQESHTIIYQSIQAKDFDKASEFMRKHLQYDMIFALKVFENR